MRRLAREQEPNEKSVLSMHHPSIAVCLWVVVHSGLIQLRESFWQIAKCTIDIMPMHCTSPIPAPLIKLIKQWHGIRFIPFVPLTWVPKFMYTAVFLYGRIFLERENQREAWTCKGPFQPKANSNKWFLYCESFVARYIIFCTIGW
jgi:hypothetical protein